ncbi:hypothetical protein VII_000696 [Vibrio mimicus MB451]|nr:hypothetical protein VII_000659 [Vibrio mimicus MB451]EEY36944.1 hypothetical protein VII_000689 [Vibrio mimicus MB451]EEY36951.1 hypothetical protein VII_000696 [Vibrio mimicus MB451]
MSHHPLYGQSLQVVILHKHKHERLSYLSFLEQLLALDLSSQPCF